MPKARTCSFVITKGKRKGEVCGICCYKNNQSCYEHGMCKLQEEKEFEGFVDKMPISILEDVCLRIAALTTRCNVKSVDSSLKQLAMLSMTCKTLWSIINESDAIWNQCWDIYVDAFPKYKAECYLKVPVKQRLLLCVFTGCQYCKRPRIRKIYEEFGVRCCTDCFERHTVRCYILTNNYGVNIKPLFALRSRSYWTYNHSWGQNLIKYYWKDDVEQFLNMPLIEYAQLSIEEKRGRQRAMNRRTVIAMISDRTYPDEFYVDYVEDKTLFSKRMDPFDTYCNLEEIVKQACEIWYYDRFKTRCVDVDIEFKELVTTRVFQKMLLGLAIEEENSWSKALEELGIDGKNALYLSLLQSY